MSLLISLSITGALAAGWLAILHLHTYQETRRQMVAHLHAERPPTPPLLRRWEDAFARTGPGEAAAAYLAKAGLPMSPLKYVALLVGAGLAVYLMGRALLGLGPLAAASVILFVIPLLTRLYLQYRRQQFLQQLQQQLPEVAWMLSNALRAGYSLPQAVGLASEQARAPARQIFMRCRQELDLGRSLGDLLHDAMKRYDSPDLRIMFAAMLVQAETGGNLIAALGRISNTIRDRQKTLGKVRAAVAQSQMTARIVPFLPFICGLFFNLAMPGFLAPLFTIPGLILLVVVLVLQVAASLVIKRITHIEV